MWRIGHSIHCRKSTKIFAASLGTIRTFISALNYTESIREDVDMVTARVNYRLGAPGTGRRWTRLN
jgi:hypothetical protein